jgi:signal transduction histidine kinase
MSLRQTGSGQEAASAPIARPARSPCEALFGPQGEPDEAKGMAWLGHLQRLASTGLLAGGMAHDLANIVQPLLGEAERVLVRDDPAEHRLALVRVREWARRCHTYVRALLDLVRRDEQHRTPVPVEQVVEDTLQLLDASRRLAGVSLRLNLDNRHVALVDRTRLMQAILNLVTNAVRAAQHGGREVEITVRGWRGWIVLEVGDNGPGVPAAVRERIFQPFVHEAVAPRAGRGRQGTGLGLYITRRLIEEQGGRIEFESGEGGGTVFRLMLEPAPLDGAMREDPTRREGSPLP